MGELSAEKLLELAREYPARYYQFEQLNIFLTSDPVANPLFLSVTGQLSSGKTCVLKRFFRDTGYSHSWISVDECLSTRVVLQRITASLRALKRRPTTTQLIEANDVEPSASDYGVACGSFAAFVEQVDGILAELRSEQAHFVVLDRIDQMGEPVEALYQFLTKVGEMLHHVNLTFILVSSAGSDPRKSQTTTYPHIFFTPYTKQETTAILCSEPLPRIRKLLPRRGTTAFAIEDEKLFSLWATYCQIIVDTYFPLYGPDIAQFKAVMRKAFAIYAKPVVEGAVAVPASLNSGWFDLYRLHRPLLSSEELISNSLFLRVRGSGESVQQNGYHDMPILSKYLLCAAYLASYNKPRHDVKLFSRIRIMRKRPRNSFHTKYKDKINTRILAPSAFEYERLLAILKCIVPEQYDSTIDIQTQFATLVSLKMIVRSGGMASVSHLSDMLESKSRWAVNVAWDVVVEISREIRLQMDGYLMD
ncbi:origin recognition complex subunit 5 C-terminus-domain-containing protein [Myxozyma melibiosi]|uniref:Origin recognition complex subunit 5 C-terminus-domain-containing protein n=1 Tax=Myxozyma melibiosi TaxID=54550 RepID=A0ABR1F7V1_9ASCO